MWIRKSILFIFFLAFSLIDAGTKYYDGNNIPYEFSFKIEGNQHRHESKDENGIINGEFGFVTADGKYHQTVYGTDEFGRFRILNRKSYQLVPDSSIPIPAKRESHPEQKVPEEEAAEPKPIVRGLSTQTCKNCHTLNADILLSGDLVTEPKVEQEPLPTTHQEPASSTSARPSSTSAVPSSTSPPPSSTSAVPSSTSSPPSSTSAPQTATHKPSTNVPKIIKPTKNPAFIIPDIEILPPKESIHLKYNPNDGIVKDERDLLVGQLPKDNQINSKDDAPILSIQLPTPIEEDAPVEEKEIIKSPSTTEPPPIVSSSTVPETIGTNLKRNDDSEQPITVTTPTATTSDIVVTKLLVATDENTVRPKAFIRSIEPTTVVPLVPADETPATSTLGVPLSDLHLVSIDDIYLSPPFRPIRTSTIEPTSQSVRPKSFVRSIERELKTPSSELSTDLTPPAPQIHERSFNSYRDDVVAGEESTTSKIPEVAITASLPFIHSDHPLVPSERENPATRDTIIGLNPPSIVATTTQQLKLIPKRDLKFENSKFISLNKHKPTASYQHRFNASEIKEIVRPTLTIADMLYKFNYTTSFHGHTEHGNSNGMKKGGYFIVGRDNIKRTVTYIATKNGFVPSIRFGPVDAEDAPKQETEREANVLKSNEFKWFIERPNVQNQV